MECAIPMCGGEEPLHPICENGHWIHADCLQLITESGTVLPICPLCRSSAVNTMKESVSIPLEILNRTPFSALGAHLAVFVGKMQRNVYN